MDYNKAYEFMKKLQGKNDLVLSCALTQLLTDGIDKCAEYDIDAVSTGIVDNAMLGKEFQIEIFKTAKEIAANISPLDIMLFIKEEVPLVGRRMGYKRMYEIIRLLIEEMIYPEDGGDHPSKEDVMEIANIDEDEWDEIMKG